MPLLTPSRCRHDPGGGTRTRRRRLALAAGAAAALLAVPAAVATAAPDTASQENPPHAMAAKRLDISMQAQEMDNWCWAAGGNTIATYMGKSHNQNAFCNAAFGRSQGTSCPNSQANLANVQDALSWTGISPGTYIADWLKYGAVQQEVNAGRPVETRVLWSAGGGHMHVLYGYDTSKSWVYWGDPWPSNNRYNWAAHDWYINNNEFTWTHSLYGIGA